MAWRILVAALAAVFVLPMPAAGQELTWRQVAFAGARVHALAVADGGKVMYLSTDFGMQVSDDGGETWLYAGQHLDELGVPAVISLAVDPQDSKVVYAGTAPGDGAGLYVTHDLGRQWRLVFSGKRGDGVSMVAFDPQQPQRILAVARGAAGRDDEIIFSENAGRSWDVVVQEGDGNARRFFAVTWLDGRSEVAVAAGAMGSMFVSRDGAQTWVEVEAPRRFFYGLATLSGRGSFLLASAERDLFFTRNAGISWQSVSGPTLPVCSAYGRNGLLVVGGQSIVLSTRSLCRNEPARVYLATNGTRAVRGTQWRELDGDLPRMTDVALAAGQDGRLYALTTDGLWQVDLPAGVGQPRVEVEPSPTDVSTPGPDNAGTIQPPEPVEDETTLPAASDSNLPGGQGTAVAVFVSLSGLGVLTWLMVTRHRRRGGGET